MIFFPSVHIGFFFIFRQNLYREWRFFRYNHVPYVWRALYFEKCDKQVSKLRSSISSIFFMCVCVCVIMEHCKQINIFKLLYCHMQNFLYLRGFFHMLEKCSLIWRRQRRLVRNVVLLTKHLIELTFFLEFKPIFRYF